MIEEANRLAQAGRFLEMLAICQTVIDSQRSDVITLLDVGALLSGHGFLTHARSCYLRAQAIEPNDFRAKVNLANLSLDSGAHLAAFELYAELQQQFPDHPVLRRNLLTSLEYASEATDVARLEAAKDWGTWAIARAGGQQPRPALKALGTPPLGDRQIRIGYVSADLCQHTVGLFVKDVIKAHDPARAQVFAYHSGRQTDWVSKDIQSSCLGTDGQFHAAGRLSDAELAGLIREDRIDVLIDLSGHTGGSRLTVFSHRPAPVMVSWLGYFATTGLPYMDAVLLDEWHAPEGTEKYFVEPIVRMTSRFCYQPVPWAPTKIAPPPFEGQSHITFGCFNNTNKLNDGVFDVWAKVLKAVSDSHLILKWRTFNDEVFQVKIINEFVERGIEAHRIELRGPSFHKELLKEYADIDIALDPFPFSGGLTSCEALWMGVPVVTWPQTRIVSRQTAALLNQIGLAELVAEEADDYVRIAVELAADQEMLVNLRPTLRARMLAAPFMDVGGFTREFENTLINLYNSIETQEKQQIKDNPLASRVVLHVGPGHRKNGAKLPLAFQSSEWKELRLDIESANEPDIVGSMLDMGEVLNASVDAVYSAHNIEHVYAHEVPQVLKEFLRVLQPDGFLMITCPDLQSVGQLVADDKLAEAAYVSPAGPITPLDILYGHGAALAAGHEFMAHKCGFTLKTLTQALHVAGFTSSAGKRRVRGLDLWVLATKEKMEETPLRELAEKILPG
jgi:protein O-GlcNAc transferase